MYVCLFDRLIDRLIDWLVDYGRCKYIFSMCDHVDNYMHI